MSKITIHPGWNLTSPDNDVNLGHDLAVLELAEALELDIVNPETNIWPVSLPEPSHQSLIMEEARVEVNGHGANPSYPGDKRTSDQLWHRF